MFGFGKKNNVSLGVRNTSHNDKVAQAVGMLDAMRDAIVAKKEKLTNLNNIADELHTLQDEVDAEFEKLFARL